MTHLTRRDVLAGLAAVSFIDPPRLARAAAAEGQILETRTISFGPHLYHGWPTLARRRSGKLVLVYSGGRESHICPFGRVEMMTSSDGGQTWTFPRTLLDGDIDDRDAGVLETAAGTLLVTTFTSLAYEPLMAKKSGEQQARWAAAHARVPAGEHTKRLGEWMIRSTDGGVTWSTPYATTVNSPHGPIQLRDGRLLYAGKQLWTDEKKIGVCESTDDGVTWRWLADIPTRDGDTVVRGYHELHAAECPSGKLVVHIRNHNKANSGETLQTESTDGGKTWSVPRAIGVWGLPSHLLRLGDGRLLMTYGHRRKPLGNQARVSADEGATWSEPILLSADAAGGDLGYPSTVQLDSGELLTVWYELPADSDKAVLRQARWRLAGR